MNCSNRQYLWSYKRLAATSGPSWGFRGYLGSKLYDFILEKMSLQPTVISVGLQEHIPVPYPEVVLTVEVHHNVRKCVKTQELCFLEDRL
ncbi:hypothetical protein K1719_029689 [Acacia pycnantha]|nr:hypothetical protein K1719_029689 [Acacia pycnantha]